MKKKNTMVKSFCSLLACLFFWLSVCFGSPVTYQISEAELVQLEQNLVQQEILLVQALSLQEMQKEELKELKVRLEEALSELRQSKVEIQRLQVDLGRASESIEKANQLFREYEKEAQRSSSRLKRQRNLYGFLAAFLGGYCLLN
jgi:hypothetical protein